MKSHQKRAFKLISLAEALDRIEQATSNQSIRVETVDTVQSLGRVLAEDIVSELYLPDHDYAAMDGFAVKTEDIQEASESNQIRLVIKGELYPPDHPTNTTIKKGETMYVACGAPIPDGADAVLTVESARQEGATILIQTPLKPNRNICLTGEDVKKQDLVIPKGRIIRPQDIGLLVALNQEKVKVTRKPHVAIISVGDELTEPFQSAPNKIINNNAYIIGSLVKSFNAEPLLMKIAKDNTEDIMQRVNTAVQQADIIITIAGCSVGVKDFVPDAVEKLGGDEGGIIFHGVAVSAGKVSGFGLVQGKPLVMLPGHVGSTVATFYLLVLPLLNSQLGLDYKDDLPVVKCVLDEPIRAGKPGIELVLPVKIYKRNGDYHAIPMRKPLSVLKNLADANGFALLPAGSSMDAGETVNIRLYGGYEFYTVGEIET